MARGSKKKHTSRQKRLVLLRLKLLLFGHASLRAASYTSILAPALPRARCFLRGGRTRACRALPRHTLRVSGQCLP